MIGRLGLRTTIAIAAVVVLSAAVLALAVPMGAAASWASSPQAGFARWRRAAMIAAEMDDGARA